MQEMSTGYAPTVVNVTAAAGGVTLLAADDALRTLELSNQGAFDVWYCTADQTPVVGSGFFLKVGMTVVHDMNSVPLRGLKAIGNGGASNVAVGRG